MMQIDWVKLGGEIVIVASILHSILPPWEAFNDFPRVQKVYKLCVYIIGYIAISARSTFYKSISTKDGTAPSEASKSSNGKTITT